jgi:hypothetical protein
MKENQGVAPSSEHRHLPSVALWGGVVSVGLGGLAALLGAVALDADFSEPGAFLIVYAPFVLWPLGLCSAALTVAAILRGGVLSPKVLIGLFLAGLGCVGQVCSWYLFRGIFL